MFRIIKDHSFWISLIMNLLQFRVPSLAVSYLDVSNIVSLQYVLGCFGAQMLWNKINRFFVAQNRSGFIYLVFSM